MTVYVDNMTARWGSMIMCHMVADTTEELLAMADQIGVARKWIQKTGTHHEHFDICKAKRALAVKAGAAECSMRDIGRLIQRKRLLAHPRPGEFQTGSSCTDRTVLGDPLDLSQ